MDLQNLQPHQKLGRRDQGGHISRPLPQIGFTNQELLKILQENPDNARQLAEQMQTDPNIAKAIGLTFGKQQLPSQPQTLANLEVPPQPSAQQVLPPTSNSGVCSLVTAIGMQSKR